MKDEIHNEINLPDSPNSIYGQVNIADETRMEMMLKRNLEDYWNPVITGLESDSKAVAFAEGHSGELNMSMHRDGEQEKYNLEYRPDEDTNLEEIQLEGFMSLGQYGLVGNFENENSVYEAVKQVDSLDQELH